eukprot:s10555_g1.t1
MPDDDMGDQSDGKEPDDDSSSSDDSSDDDKMKDNDRSDEKKLTVGEIKMKQEEPSNAAAGKAVAPVLGRTAGALACGFSGFFGCKCSLLQEPSNAAGDKAVAPVLGRTAGALACGFSGFFGCKCCRFLAGWHGWDLGTACHACSVGLLGRLASFLLQELLNAADGKAVASVLARTAGALACRIGCLVWEFASLALLDKALSAAPARILDFDRLHSWFGR